MTPTYQSGFAAPGRGVPKYPELWKGCVGAWNPGLGPTGLTLMDWSGFGNNSTDVNLSQWGVNSVGYSTNFNGSQSYTIPHVNRYTQDNAISVAVFAKANSLSGNPFLLDKDYNSSFYMQLYGSNQIEFGARFIAGGYINTPANAYTLMVPQHFVGTFNASSDTVRIYTNGVQRAVSTAATAAMPTGTAAIRVGRKNTSATQFLNGSIYEIRIYSREITPNEVSILATRPGIAYELAPRKSYFLPPSPSSQFYDVLSPSIFAGSI